MEFTREQMLIATMLAEIHQALKIKDGVDSELVSKAIWSDNAWAIDWKIQLPYPGRSIDPPHVTHVIDVLDMYSLLRDSHAALSAPDQAQYATQVKHGAPEFPGFDGNNEAEYLSAARFLVDEMDRFASYKGKINNSHFPTADRSNAMLEVFLPIRAKLGVRHPMVLNVVELVAVMNA